MSDQQEDSTVEATPEEGNIETAVSAAEEEFESVAAHSIGAEEASELHEADDNDSVGINSVEASLITDNKEETNLENINKATQDTELIAIEDDVAGAVDVNSIDIVSHEPNDTTITEEKRTVESDTIPAVSETIAESAKEVDESNISAPVTAAVADTTTEVEESKTPSPVAAAVSETTTEVDESKISAPVTAAAAETTREVDESKTKAPVTAAVATTGVPSERVETSAVSSSSRMATKTSQDVMKMSGNDELKFGVLIGLVRVGQLSNKEVVDSVLSLVS